ncbi:MAG: glycosyltransferase family 4 protein [Cyanobacteriota bacterium]
MGLQSVGLQLVREWPPGFGGVERVAHEIASEYEARGEPLLTLSLQGPPRAGSDPLPVTYGRQHLPSLQLGQLLLPLPSARLLAVLASSQPLQLHLPCPGLLGLAMVARLWRPRRFIALHWHAFLEPSPGPKGWLVSLYQWLALRWMAVAAQRVVTTSPVLAEALVAAGIPSARVTVLPCCLPASLETAAASIQQRRLQGGVVSPPEPFRLLFIGRLSSYKRVDWLIRAFEVSAADELHIVGEGVLRPVLERQASQALRPEAIVFHGQLSEASKLGLLAQASLLVLPASASNEGFGIVQLEAMACGVPALALWRARSGMAWVGGLDQLPGFPQPGQQAEWQQLAAVIQWLIDQPDTWWLAARSARQRYERVFARAVWQEQVEELLP